MERNPEYGQESGLYHQQYNDENDTERTHTTIVPHPDGEGADLEEQGETLNPPLGEELIEEEEKDRK